MNDDTLDLPRDDAIIHAFFRLATIQTRNLMRLSHALRYDPAVSDDTKKAASDAFESINEMLDILDKISMTAWGTDSHD